MTEFFYKAAGAVIAPFRYAEREAQALKEHVKEDIQTYVAIYLKLAVAAMAGLLFLLFISIAAANWLNGMMNSDVAGFLIVALFYLAIAGVMYVLKLADDRKKRETDVQRRAMQGKPIHA
jgi:TRAP-type C4-dicarboxylate transport system permease large subunit